jgi:hypothetical protein
MDLFSVIAESMAYSTHFTVVMNPTSADVEHLHCDPVDAAAVPRVLAKSSLSKSYARNPKKMSPSIDVDISYHAPACDSSAALDIHLSHATYRCSKIKASTV